MKTLFDMKQPCREWSTIATKGYAEPIPGALFRASSAPCCGMPLGGLGTGCVDIDAAGVWGYNSMFNGYTYNSDTMHVPRVAPTLWPMFGLSTEDQVWVLATQQIIDGGYVPYCTEPMALSNKEFARDVKKTLCQDIRKVKGVQDIVYFGHYPIVDMEYITDAPITVGLRAWSPFIPGDALTSNIPAAVFEVHVRNGEDKSRKGTLAFNFAGPSAIEAMSGQFLRTPVNEGQLHGVMVSADGSDVGYFLGALEAARIGASLNRNPHSWAGIAKDLPKCDAVDRNGGGNVTLNADASVAVDFDLNAGEEKVLRFILAWYSPFILGSPKACSQLDRLKDIPGAEINSYTSMYAARFRTPLDVAYRMAAGYESMLARVIAWQSALYAEKRLPGWLRDQLLSTLVLIPEDSYWVQPRPPIGDFAFPGGLFGLNESSRDCPHMECIPCDFYGNMPIVYFFPELGLSTMRAFKEYQHDDGNIAFELGACWGLPDFATPTYEWQKALNGSCYIIMADRLWQATGDDRIVTGFYESLKRCNTFLMNLNTNYGGPISMPTDGPKTEWFEFGDWDGMCAHMGGVRLAQLQIMKRFSEKMEDSAYAAQCQAWFDEGSHAMENDLWTGEYYLNFLVKETGRVSDEVMAYQNIGQWISVYHGFDGVFDHDRTKIALETVKRVNIPLTPACGAANFARPDAAKVSEEDKIAFYGATACFNAEAVMLGMVYMQEGQWDFGLDFIRKVQYCNGLDQGHNWDLPCIIRGDTGERKSGTDYYQNMMLWSVPATVLGTDLKGLCAPGGYIDTILKAGAAGDERNANSSSTFIYSVPPTA